jgi:hypothetical protein
LDFRHFRGQGRKVNIWLGVLPDGMGRSGTDNAIGTGSIPKMADLAGPDIHRPVEPASQWRHQRHKHEVVKEAVMSRRFSLPACLVLLCAAIALGAAGMEAGAQAPSPSNPNTRSIQLDTAGETTATKSPNE